MRTIHLDLPALAGAFSRRLREAGVPITAERAARFAHALALVRPVSRRRLYWTARAVLVSDSAQVKAFDSVFARCSARASRRPSSTRGRETAPAAERSAAPEPRRGGAGAREPRPRPPARGEDDELREVAVPMAASDEEVLRSKRFDALAPGELAQLYRLMARLEVATPRRRTRRSERDRRGERMDMRRTLRGKHATGGGPDPPRAAAQARRRAGAW